MNKTCPKCHTINRPEAKFCQSCNYALSESGAGPVLCPAGRHPMDPAWSACPYCSGMSGAVSPAATDRMPPSMQSSGVSGRIPPLPNAPAGRRPPTEVENPSGASLPTVKDMQPPAAPSIGVDSGFSSAGGSGRKRTAFGGVDPGAQTVGLPSQMGTQSPQPRGRRIRAVLVTYSWQAEGQVFPVYEGRNYLGSESDCEICLTSDRQLSGHHAAIFFRGESFEITDEKSMNGTFLDNRSVPLTGLSLRNYSTIKTGATLWRFIIIEPELTASTGQFTA